MKGFYKIAAGLLIALSTVSSTYAENVIISTPADFQVLAMSPNGKWACGVYQNAVLTLCAFRWNLETDKVELLGDSNESIAWGIANDGTVSGNYQNTDILPQGRPVQVVAINRPGKGWEPLELPEGFDGGEGVGYAITPDGRSVSGSVLIGNLYTPYIWRDGKVYKNLSTGKHAMPYAISPDGEAAAGWAYGTENNRVSTYWKPDCTPVYLKDSKVYGESMFAAANAFSPDGSKVVYWGGWDPEGTTSNALYCLYDIATDERTKIPTLDYDSTMQFYCMSNSGFMGGVEQERGFVYFNGECMYIDDFLKAINVDLSTYEGFYSGDDGYFGQNYPISRVACVTPDTKTFIFLYYDKAGSTRSMCLKTDVDVTLLPPAGLTARHLEGTSTVELEWQAPLGSKNARGYYVYRNGKRLNVLPQKQLTYTDDKLADGEYAYEVGFVSAAGVETKCEPVNVTVAPSAPAAPYSLFARNKGINSALLDWEPVESGLLHKRYFDPAKSKYSEFCVYAPVEMEAAIMLPAGELKHYAGATIDEVTFVPMGEQEAWSILFYTRNADGALAEVARQDVSQPLTYGKLNTVQISEPVAIPAEDLYVAVRTKVKVDSNKVLGSIEGPSTPGRSDLLRQITEEDFYSAYESSVNSGLYVSSFNWAIDVALRMPDGSQITPRELDKYLVSCDGEAVGDTNATTFEITSLADGAHTFAVKALYTDGSESASAEKTLEVKNTYAAVDIPKVEVANVDEKAEVTATWDTPVNNDRTRISYTTATTHTRGVNGPENTMIIGALYTPEMLRTFGGYKIDTVKFYPMCQGIFTVSIYKNGSCIYEKEAEEIIPERWNELQVDEDIFIDSNAEYRLTVDVFDAQPNMKMFGVDNVPGYENRSDLFSIDGGETWSALGVETSLKCSWLLAMDIVNTAEATVVPEAYDVVFDGNVLNDSRLSDTAYTFSTDFDKARHSLEVNAYYAGLTESVKGKATVFKLQVSGLDDVTVTDIALNVGENLLVVEGEGILGVDLFTVKGIKAASAAGNTVKISDLSAGVYVVSVRTAGGTLTRKIRIK